MVQENKGNGEKFLTGKFVVISAVSFILRLGMAVMLTAVPLYDLSIGFSKTSAGIMMTVYTMSALVLRPLVGYLVDRYGRKTILSISIVLYALSMVMIAFTKSLSMLYISQSLNGIAFSAYSVALTTMITDIVPESRLTEGLGYYGLTATVAQALGPTLALALIAGVGYQGNFLSVAAFCFLMLVPVLFIRYEREEWFVNAGNKRRDKTEPEQPLRWWERLIERNAIPSSALVCVMAFILAATTTFLVPYAEEAGIEGIGSFFIVRAVGIMVSRVLAGTIERKISTKAIIVIGILGMTIGTGGVYFFSATLPLLVVAFLYGLCYGLLSVILNVHAVKNTPPHRRAAANATYYLAMDAGMGIGAAAWGALADVAGLKSIFVAGAALSLVILFAFLLLSGVKRRRAEQRVG